MSLVAKVGATVLDRASDKEFLDELADTGRFALTFKNGDSQIPADGTVVTFAVNGTDRWAGVVDHDTIVSKASEEAQGELTTVSGLGVLGVTKKGAVRPSRGVGSLPLERSRSQFWGAWDFDISGMPLGKNIRRADAPTSYAPNRSMPEWWPAKEAWWVWADQVDVDEDDAPLGRCLIWHDFTVASDSEIEIHIGANNQGYAYLNSIRLGDISNSPKDGQRFRETVTAGTQRLAASVTNFIRDGGFICAVWTVDDDGLLDELISISDETNTKVLGYPDDVPTISQGEAIRRIVEQMQARGELTGVTLDFDDDDDSAGNPWDGVVEVATQVGTSGLEYLTALSDWAVDLYMTPAKVLKAWNWGTRGTVTSVSVVGTSDRLTSEVEGLSHDGVDVRANRLLVAYRRGLFEVEDAAAITANGGVVVTDFFECDVELAETARAEALAELERRKQKSYATTLRLAPDTTTPTAVPYVHFDVGDYIEHPDEAGGTKVSRVLSIAVKEDTEGNLYYDLELHEIRLSWRDRRENTLKRYAMGSLAGGSRATGPTGADLPSLSRISEKQVGEHHFQDPIVGAKTGSRPAESSGNLIEINVELTTEGDVATTGSSSVTVYKNGVSIGTVTVATGETSAALSLDGAKVYRNVDRFRVEVVTLASQVNGINVQVRAI